MVALGVPIAAAAGVLTAAAAPEAEEGEAGEAGAAQCIAGDAITHKSLT